MTPDSASGQPPPPRAGGPAPAVSRPSPAPAASLQPPPPASSLQPPPPAASRQPPAGQAEALRAALAEIGDLFGEIVKTAEAKAFLRCPYMNVKRECTAKFECRNQVFAPRHERPICSGLHKINFCYDGGTTDFAVRK